MSQPDHSTAAAPGNVCCIHSENAGIPSVINMLQGLWGGEIAGEERPQPTTNDILTPIKMEANSQTSGIDALSLALKRYRY